MKKREFCNPTVQIQHGWHIKVITAAELNILMWRLFIKTVSVTEIFLYHIIKCWAESASRILRWKAGSTQETWKKNVLISQKKTDESASQKTKRTAQPVKGDMTN